MVHILGPSIKISFILQQDKRAKVNHDPSNMFEMCDRLLCRLDEAGTNGSAKLTPFSRVLQTDPAIPMSPSQALVDSTSATLTRPGPIWKLLKGSSPLSLLAQSFCKSLLSTRFPTACLSAAHFWTYWPLDWSLAAKWAELTITYQIASSPTHQRSNRNESCAGWSNNCRRFFNIPNMPMTYSKTHKTKCWWSSG